MTVRYKEDDWGTGVDDGSGNPKLLVRKWITIIWDFPAQYNSEIQGFEVVAFIGSDPTDAASWVFQPKAASPTDRQLIVAVSPNANLTNLNASARAIYV